MNTFFENLMRSEILPFIEILGAIGGMLLHAFLFCLLICCIAFAAFWLGEAGKATVEMRPARSGLRLLKHICAMAMKPVVIPSQAQKILFVAAPIFAFVTALFFFFFLPVNEQLFRHPDFSLLYLLFVTSCCTCAFIAAGWSGATQYSLFGAVRFIAQSFSCQLVLAIIVMIVLMTTGADDLSSVIRAQQGMWFVVPHFPMFVLYMLTVSMMTGRSPFSAPRFTRDLAGGVFAEYSGSLYLMFSIGEKLLTLLCSALAAVLFLGGTAPAFGIQNVPAGAWLLMKTFAVLSLSSLTEYALPDWRTDQQMNMCFKIFLPFSMLWLAGTAMVLYGVTGGQA